MTCELTSQPTNLDIRPSFLWLQLNIKLKLYKCSVWCCEYAWRRTLITGAKSSRMKGFLIAAPSSGSGKTTITLGLLRALQKRDIKLAPVKVGADFIDPVFHEAACGETCYNLDPWSMRPELISALTSRITEGGKFLVAEGMMGLFDGALDGKGSAADLAQMLGLPVILVVDCAKQSHSVAALVKGFSDFRRSVMISGIILNKVGSARHEMMLREALNPLGIPVLGAIPRDAHLKMPERHLGLVQAVEHSNLDKFIEYAASLMEQHISFSELFSIANRVQKSVAMANVERLPALGEHIAIARDAAFNFAYPHIINGWKRRGTQISFFSPLADEVPDIDADAVYLPGGYPELYAGQLSQSKSFFAAMHKFAADNKVIYGEGGGYMVLGETIEDAEGVKHKMLGLLPLETSAKQKRLHLGYRKIRPLDGSVWQVPMRGHEFHYSSITHEGAGEQLFEVWDALDEPLGKAGLRVGNVSGSFMHMIDMEAITDGNSL